MSYSPEYFWKNFRLGTELQISGSFIYNALYFFDQMEHFCNEEEIFEFLYDISVGLERLEKIAVILLEHNGSISQEEFERTLITHSHLELFERIRKKAQINLGKTHTKFIQLISNLYKSMRYNRYNISSVYEPNQDKFRFVEFIQNELNETVKANTFFPTRNSNRIKKFIGKLVGKIVSQLYEVVKVESRRLNMATYEIRFDSKAYKIFTCQEFTFYKENLFKKEIILYLMNNPDKDGFVNYIKEIEPLPFEMYATNEHVKYLINPHKRMFMADEMECIYEDNFDKNRLDSVNVIGENVYFDSDEDNDDKENNENNELIS